MKSPNDWLIMILILVTAIIAIVFLAVVMKRRKPNASQSQEPLIQLIREYLGLAKTLAAALRFAFDHPEQLKPENEAEAENLIDRLEHTQASIKQKISEISASGNTKLASDIEEFLLRERNVRHASPPDLEQYIQKAGPAAEALIHTLKKV